MTLPVSGRISLDDVNVELGLTSNARITLTQASVRTLFGVASGRIALAADGHGKSNRAALSYVFSSNTTETTVTASSLPGYVAGKTDLTITVNSGVYVYSTSTSIAGLTITGTTTGDTVVLVNNGYIIGKGGNGGAVGRTMGVATPGSPGGPALSLGCNVSLTNNSYIAGGGGGGASYTYGSTYFASNGGGGGAGGGNGGAGYSSTGSYVGAGTGSTTPGTSGNNCQGYGTALTYGGGGGGMILPGVRVTTRGAGGEAGGAGSGGTSDGGYGGAGGEAGGTVGNDSSRRSGGGGGWGSDGGSSAFASGGAGGKGIVLNGYSVTYITNGTIYGAVS